MICYKKYIKVLWIIKNPDIDTPEMKASAICDLFDTQSYKNIEVDMNTGTFWSFWHPIKWEVKSTLCNHESDGTILTSYPPQYRCKKCWKTYLC